MPTGIARDRTYPRSVVLGHGFLAEPVLRRLLRALPVATHVSTYGRNPDLLPQLQRLGAHRAASAADLAARSEYVLVLLQKLEDLEADLSGPSGLQAGVHSPTILVVGAISTPDDLRNLASELAEKTAGLLRVGRCPAERNRGSRRPWRAVHRRSAPHPASIESLPVLELLGPAYASAVWAAPRLRMLVSSTS